MGRFSSLKWQILQKVILVHGIVALLLTSIQLYVDYNQNLNSIKKNLSSSYEMFGPPLSEAFYHVNNKMIEEIFQGVLSQSDFLSVAVYDRLSDEFIIRGELDIDTNALKSYLKDDSLFFNLKDNPEIIAYQHSMKIEGELNEEKYFGNLIVFSKESLAFDRIENTILIVFFNSLIKAMVLVLMFLLIFNRLLIQPLTKINNVVSNLSSDNLKSFRLDLNISKSNELYLFQIRFNKLLDDLYEAQEKERVLQHQSKFSAIGEMIGNIAHQWRQPLASVNMIIAILLEKQQQKTLEPQYLTAKLLEIERLNIYMSETIENFLEFFNPDKSKEIFNINEVVNNSIKILKGKFEKENVSVTSSISSDLSINANKQELMQVIIILLSNSIDSIVKKASFDDRKIEIEAFSKDDEISICIKDFGHGVKTDIIDRIFEPYFTQKHKDQGVGLGLYIAKMIIEKSFHGEITIENHDNGAKFCIGLKKLQ